MPKVSVIIPVYGVEKYIEQCARSLFSQTLDDIEYLFIDDCTPDCSIDILKKVLEEYPNRKEQVIIHRMEQNSGQARVREWGMKNVIGEYVIHCDSDDWMESNAFEIMYKTACQNDSDIVYGDFNIINKNKTVRKGEVTNNDAIGDYLSGIIRGKYSANLWNKIIKRELYENNSDFIFPRNSMGEDFVLTTQLAILAKRVNAVNSIVYNYVVNNNSISYSSDKKIIKMRVLQEMANTILFRQILHDNNLYNKYINEITVRMVNCSMMVLPLIREHQYYKIWKSYFKGIASYSIIINKYIPLKDKIIYCLCKTRLYSILKK